MEEFIKEVDLRILLLVSGFLPLVQAVINRKAWATETKALAAFVVAVGVGVGSALVMGISSRDGILTNTAGIYALSQIGYFGVLRPTGLANAIEEKTG